MAVFAANLAEAKLKGGGTFGGFSLGQLLKILGRHAAWALCGGVTIGLILPDLASLMRPFLAPCVILILATALLRVEISSMAGIVRRPGLIASMVVWCMLVSPILIWAFLGFLPLPASLIAAIVMMAAAPPILGATGLAMVLGLDSTLAAVVVLICTILTPLSVPPLVLMLLGLELDIALGDFMLRLALLIGASLGLALAVKHWTKPSWLDARTDQVNGLFVLFMLVFAVGIMDGVRAVIETQPGQAALWLGAAFAANLGLQILGALAFSRLGRRQTLTAGLLSGNCNMGILLVALPPEGNFGIVLFFALAQLPMYMLPALLAPGYRRLLGTPT